MAEDKEKRTLIILKIKEQYGIIEEPNVVSDESLEEREEVPVFQLLK